MEEKIPFYVLASFLILYSQVHDKIRSESHNACCFCAVISSPLQKQADLILSNWWALVSKALNSRLLLKSPDMSKGSIFSGNKATQSVCSARTQP